MVCLRPWLVSSLVATCAIGSAVAKRPESTATFLSADHIKDAGGDVAHSAFLQTGANVDKASVDRNQIQAPVAPAWAPERAALPELDDSVLSGPGLFARMIGRASSSLLSGHGEISAAHTALLNVSKKIRIHWWPFVFGLIGLICGVMILWFNELRDVKISTMLSRGLNECESISSTNISDETYGKIVHVQGQVSGMVPVQDPQFQGAAVSNCLKLQSVVEIFEWVQTVKIKEKPQQNDAHEKADKKNAIQYTFHKEWSTIHRSSLHFQRSAGKPAPDNPKPPRGLNLGTFTTKCQLVQLGDFILPEDMTEQFRKFEPAMRYLPPTVQACGLVFYANKDGYFYARPSMRSMWSSSGGPSTEPMVGDVRVRFLCVPQCAATAVAVHCIKDGRDTFVPYRPIPRTCCTSEDSYGHRLIEEGSRSLSEVKVADQDMTPCLESNRACTSCFCCPCTTINRCCIKEVVTEEIYYVSDTKDPVEKSFERVVPRNYCRVWFFRTLGLAVCFMACFGIFSVFWDTIKGAPGLSFYRDSAPLVLSLATAGSVFCLVMAVAHFCYSPPHSLKWAIAVAVLLSAPFVVGEIKQQ